MNYFQRRQMRKIAGELLRHAVYARAMREDVARAAVLDKLASAEAGVRSALKSADFAEIERQLDRLESSIRDVMPVPRFRSLREWVEVAAVALSVAMACRCYFIQPFKIPTGSMQPTLWGVHSRVQAGPALMDHMPLKLVKWFIYGEWYAEVRAKSSGYFSVPVPKPPYYYYFIDGIGHKLPPDAGPNFMPGDYVNRGELLWSGVWIAGDHVFVNKISWNFRRPRRSEVMVFLTNGIEDLRASWNSHYIKRTIGLPGERVALDPPFVRIDGERITEWMIGRIARQEHGYDGYKLAEDPRARWNSCNLGPGKYFALGDNTGCSRDSRYWGTVPQENLVGPGWLVYWPFWPHWGRISR